MKKLIFGILLTLSFPIFSQTGEKNFIDQNYIEVTGKAEMNIIPDMIYLKIILSDKDNKNKQTLVEIEKSMTNKLLEIGIDISTDLTVSDFSSNFKNYWISKSNVFLTKEYQLIVHDSKTLQKVYYELQNLDISNISIIKLDHSKIVQFRKEVKVNAIKAAKEKAEYLTTSINQTIGKAIYIQELDMPYYTNTLSNRVSGVNVTALGISKSYDESTIPEIEFDKINLQYTILVRFELK